MGGRALSAIERFWFFAPPGRLPSATAAEGPDPYGNPDPEWLRIDPNFAALRQNPRFQKLVGGR